MLWNGLATFMSNRLGMPWLLLGLIFETGMPVAEREVVTDVVVV